MNLITICYIFLNRNNYKNVTDNTLKNKLTIFFKL